MNDTLQKISDTFTGLFGSAGKWVLLGLVILGVAIAITLGVLTIVNIKKIIIVGVVLAVLAVGGVVVYNKYFKKSEA